MKLFWLWACLAIWSVSYGQDLQLKHQKALSIVNPNNKIDALYNLYFFADSAIKGESSAKISILQDALNISKKYNHAKGIMQGYFHLGNEFNTQNNLVASIENYINCQKYAEQFKSDYYLSRGLMGIGLVHYKQERWKMSYDFFIRGLNVSRNLKDIHRTGTQLYLAGLCKGRMGMFPESLILLDSALAIFITGNNSESILETKIGRAYALRKMGLTDSANNLYLEVLQSLNNGTWHDVYAGVVVKTGLSEIEFKNGRLNEALQFATQAEKELFIDTLGSWIHLDLFDILGRIYLAKGDYKTALAYHLKYQKLHDNARNWDAGVLAIERQTLFDFEKKQAISEARFQSELLNQKRSRIGLIIIAGIMLLLALVVLWAYRAVSKQKILSEKLLLNILPEETANELKKHGAAIPKKHPEVAIFFADIKGFTHIAENMPPENIVKKLDDFFSRFDEIMEKYGLEKIKTIGDAYMAVAGLNSSSPNPSLAAVKAAWAIIESVEKINARYPVNETPFSFRIGINTGPVISGVVGKNKYSYDIWGDSVNVAARMEQSSHPGSINITGKTWENINHVFECTYRGKIAAKNKGHIDMYYVDYLK